MMDENFKQKLAEIRADFIKSNKLNESLSEMESLFKEFMQKANDFIDILDELDESRDEFKSFLYYYERNNKSEFLTLMKRYLRPRSVTIEQLIKFFES